MTTPSRWWWSGPAVLGGVLCLGLPAGCKKNLPVPVDAARVADAQTGGDGAVVPVPDAAIVRDAVSQETRDTGVPPKKDTAPPVPDAPAKDAPAVSVSTVRFIAVGDTGSVTSTLQSVAAAMKTKCDADGCDFVALMGDNIYPTGVTSDTDLQFKTKFEQPFAGVDAIFQIVLGNHDYGNNGAGDEFDKGAYQIAYTKLSQKWRLPSAYYHFVQGPAEFFTVDSNMQTWNMDKQQQIDMAAWIAASTPAWKISFGHHPYLSNGLHGNAGNYKADFRDGSGVKAFFEKVLCAKIDFAVTAHDHSRQWIEATCSGTELAVTGGGSSTTSLPGNNKSRFESLTPGFLYVVITGKTLTAQFIDDGGTVDFTRTLNKP